MGKSGNLKVVGALAHRRLELSKSGVDGVAGIGGDAGFGERVVRIHAFEIV